MGRASKLIEGKFRVAKGPFSWLDFSIQKGHIFGLYEGVCYVTGLEPDKRDTNKIFVYKQQRTSDGSIWHKVSIPSGCELGKLLRAARANSPIQEVIFYERKPCLRWTAKERPKAEKGGTWTGADIKAPHYHAMSQSRKDHYNPMPPMPKRKRTWVDQICREAMMA